MCLLEFSNLFCLGPLGFINLMSFSLHVLSKLNISYYSVLLLTLYTVLGKSLRKPEIVENSVKECIENFNISHLGSGEHSDWHVASSFPGAWAWGIQSFPNLKDI